MRRKVSGLLLVLSALFFLKAGPASGLSYFGFDDFGGIWHDAEKTLSNTEDDLMCWAAAASNMLTYTGWGFPAGEGFTGTDDIFAYFQGHWTDSGGSMYYGAEWWFDGTNNSPGRASGWSQVDAPGGGFYPGYNFSDYYTWSSYDSIALDNIDTYLHAGRGVGLAMMGPGAHAITAWGYEYDEFGNYLGVYVTDSDNASDTDSPADILAYYDIRYSGGGWYLQDFYGSDFWYIGEVHGLAPMPAPVASIPEPATLLLVGAGLFGLAWVRRRFPKG
ncbi:MAG: IdeS/Mac family cysteine endopeptidase [Desulfosarcina sp.]|nr:IdeS/Mac family cysteine endopeptidase [Desulfobacterales bacterium]